MTDDISNLDYILLNRPKMMAILGHCMLNPGFLRNCSKCLDASNIQDLYVSDLYDFVVKYHKLYLKPPTVAEVESYIFSKYSDLSTAQKYRAVLYESIDLHVKNFRIEALSADISGWLRMVFMHKGIVSMTSLFNKSQYSEAGREIIKLVNKIKDAGFDADDRVTMSNMGQIIDSLAFSRDKACTLGHPEFDELIMADSKINKQDARYIENNLSGRTKGSLLPGEMTILIGPTNIGKTTAVSTIAASNIAMGKKVCYVGCEDPKDKLSVKFMQSFYQKKLTELHYTQSQEFLTMSAEWDALTTEKLYYYEWIKPSKMYVEDVIDVIESAQEKAIAKDGKGFDLLIVDYPGILMSREIGRGKDEWVEKRYVYYQFRLLAKKHNFHTLAPIQTNREGFKANAASEKILDMGDVAQGFGITNDADNVITINRTPSDYSSHRIKFFIAKSRSGENKRMFVSEVRFDLGRTHGLNFAYAIFETVELKDINDEQIMTKRLSPRKMTSHILVSKSSGDGAYSVAAGSPPLDAVQAKQSSSWSTSMPTAQEVDAHKKNTDSKH
jgi:KaiC/GvpD/RAD55 family RecA-like ATPase